MDFQIFNNEDSFLNLRIQQNQRVFAHLNAAVTEIKSKYSKSPNIKRDEILHHLEEYANERNFPVNSEFYLRTPIFLDKFGILCAVGYLIYKTIGFNYAKQIDDLYHRCKIKEMEIQKLPFLYNWIRTYGLDLEDLARVQPGYDGICEYLLGQIVIIFLGFSLNLAILIYSCVLNNENSDDFLMDLIIIASISLILLFFSLSLSGVSMKFMQSFDSFLFALSTFAYIIILAFVDQSEDELGLNILIWTSLGFFCLLGILSLIFIFTYEKSSKTYWENFKKRLEEKELDSDYMELQNNS